MVYVSAQFIYFLTEDLPPRPQADDLRSLHFHALHRIQLFPGVRGAWTRSQAPGWVLGDQWTGQGLEDPAEPAVVVSTGLCGGNASTNFFAESEYFHEHFLLHMYIILCRDA